MSTDTKARPAKAAAETTDQPSAREIAKAAKAAASTGYFEGVVLRKAAYDPRSPEAPAPERLRKDPRIADQRLTASSVELAGVPVGRVVMVEFEDRRGWFYAAETVDPAKPRSKPKRLEVFPSQRAAVRAVLEAVASRATA